MIPTGFKRSSALAVLVLLSAVTLLAGCMHSPNPETPFVFEDSQDATLATGTNNVPLNDAGHSILRVGDLLIITFSDVINAPPRQEINVPSTGIITLPYNVHVKAAGKTFTELESDIRKEYVPKLFVNLTVTVKPEQRVFYIDGEVKTPGRHPYYGEMTVLRAISTAGGFTDFAKKTEIEVRRQGGKKFVVNWKKAVTDHRGDLAVFPNDYILVKRGWF